MNKDCLFCKIIKGEIPANILYEDQDIMVFLDAYPNSDGHTLIIPKTHYTDITEIPDETLLKLFQIGKKYTSKIMNTLNKDSVSYLINYGEEQAIKHIHLHLIPEFQKAKTSISKEVVFDLLKG